MAELRQPKFKFRKTCDMENHIKVQIISLDGMLPTSSFKDILSNPCLRIKKENGVADLIVEAYIWSPRLGRKLSLVMESSYKDFTTTWEWNEWLLMPLRFCDTLYDAVLVITIYDFQLGKGKIAIGGTNISLFTENTRLLRQEVLLLKVWPDIHGDPVTTPGEVDVDLSLANSLSKLVREQRLGMKPERDWQDRIAFRSIEAVNREAKSNSKYMGLLIQFESFDSDVMWWTQTNPNNKPYKYSKLVYFDPDLEGANSVEVKHRTLTRNNRAKDSDKNEKPEIFQRNWLKRIGDYPSDTHLNSKEQDMLWRYRYHATGNKKLLVKFLKCTNFESETETRASLEMLPLWEHPDPHEALEILGSVFTNSDVRKYAVDRLGQTSDEDLLLYMLQLVQALRYEPWDMTSTTSMNLAHYSLDNFVSSTLVGSQMGSSLADCELAKGCLQDSSGPLCQQLLSPLDNDAFGAEPVSHASRLPPLATFLIDRSANNPVIANYLYWYVKVQSEEENQRPSPNLKFRFVYSTMVQLVTKTISERETTHMRFRRQYHFVTWLTQTISEAYRNNTDRLIKCESLRSLLNSGLNEDYTFKEIEPFPLPLDPTVQICGMRPDKLHLFKSAMEPCKLVFTTTEGDEYPVIFKNGDDLRQDQLLVQLISLMDALLQHEGLDLKLTAYKVLPTTCKQGFVQFIESNSINEILRSDVSIQNYLRKYAGDVNTTFGISEDVMDNYIKSCAGYCVITYILGVGDRHSDNLMLTKQGNFFHIDFGYILGHDPKLYAPLLKLSKEMIEAMGGHPHYGRFKTLCFTSFTILRKHSQLFFNLLTLMSDSSIPNLSSASRSKSALNFMKEKFDIDNSEEAALYTFKTILEASAGALSQAFFENIHTMAMFFRK